MGTLHSFEMATRYTVNGQWRPCFSQFKVEDGWLDFRDLGKKAQLPLDQAGRTVGELVEKGNDWMVFF